MGRKSLKSIRRAEILQGFARVLANHGYAGATMTAVGAAAGMSPGLLHHHFDDKREMLSELIDLMAKQVDVRLQSRRDEGSEPLTAYLEASLRLDHRSDQSMAKCWVGIFAEAVRDPEIYQVVDRFINSHLRLIRELSQGGLEEQDAGAVLAFVVGSLVLGAFAPKKISGFAFPSAVKLVAGLLQE